jgi:PAS domain S-box-containing protein
MANLISPADTPFNNPTALEEQRLSALRRLEILDTPPDESFDRITQLASRIFDIPIALVSLVDEHRQWFKSCWGLADYGIFTRETPRELSFCTHALTLHEVLAIPDTLADPRVADHPMVVNDPHIRFYAGAPLRVKIPQIDGETLRSDSDELEDGTEWALGTLCLVDTQPHPFGRAQRATLRDLASLVENELRLRYVTKQFQQASVNFPATAARFQSAFEQAPNGMALVSPDGKWLQCNARLCALLGRSEAELKGRNWDEVLSERDRGPEAQRRKDMLQCTTDRYHLPVRFIHSDGHLVAATLDVALARHESGEAAHFVIQTGAQG